MTEAYAIANDQLRREKAALHARAEAAEKERDISLDYLYSLGRYYGRPRQADETVESWAGRVTKAIHANQEPAEVSVQLREELDQLQGVNARLKAEGLAAIERAKTAERQHVDAAARAETAEKERDELRDALKRIHAFPGPQFELDELRKSFDRVKARCDSLQAERDNTHLNYCKVRDERDAVKAAAVAQLEAVTAERDQATIARDDVDARMRGWKRAYDGVCAKLTAAKCRIADLEAANATVTADRDDMAQKFAHGWIEREVDARLMAELEQGPVAHERNQLRDELAELRPQVDDLRAKLAAAEHRAAMHERDAERMARAADTLETMFNAAISAVSRGNR